MQARPVRSAIMVMDVVGIVLLVAAIGVVIFALAYQVRARRDNDRDR